MLDHNTSKDAPKEQVMAFDDNSITMDRIPPFGHIGLTLAKGTLPERFQGVYTSFDLATHAALQYIEMYWKTKAEAIKNVAIQNISIKKQKVNETESDSDREQLR